MATVRGNDSYYKKIPFHHGVFHFTSMPTGENKLFDHSEYYKKSGFDIRTISDNRIDLQLEFMKAKSKKEKLEIWQGIDELNRLMKFEASTGKHKLLYTEFNTFDNIENLGLKYIQQQFDSMPLVLFLIEILNKRMTKVTDSFYAFLDRNTHGYKGKFDYSYLEGLDFLNMESTPSLDSRQDEDCFTTLPLHLGLDFGSAINWAITAQYIKPEHTLNFINNHYVKSPYIIDDVINNWCDYYKYHRKKLVYLYPGADGLNKQANVKGQRSYVEQIKVILRKKGWTVVVRKTEKYEFSHHDKYLCWARSLSQIDSRYPILQFNLIHCKELFLSMEQTPAKDYGGKIQKDKKSEKNLIDDREKATDSTDAADQILFTLFGKLNTTRGEPLALSPNSF